MGLFYIFNRHKNAENRMCVYTHSWQNVCNRGCIPRQLAYK